jgi:hypothetical protein
VACDEFLDYALDNRTEWEAKGQEIVAQMLEEAEHLFGGSESPETLILRSQVRRPSRDEGIDLPEANEMNSDSIEDSIKQPSVVSTTSSAECADDSVASVLVNKNDLGTKAELVHGAPTGQLSAADTATKPCQNNNELSEEARFL